MPSYRYKDAVWHIGPHAIFLKDFSAWSWVRFKAKYKLVPTLEEVVRYPSMGAKAFVRHLKAYNRD